jgi:anti-sigma B factor antagonist
MDTIKQQAKGVELNFEKLNADTVLVQMSGYIDTYNSTDCQEQINGIMRQGVLNLIVDMRQINYVSSTGIGVVFVDTLKRVKKLGGDVILCGIVPRVEEVFQLLGFKTFFTRADTVEEAMDYLPSVPKIDIPFARMEALTATFAELEGYIKPSNEIDFYAALLRILRQIEELKR